MSSTSGLVSLRHAPLRMMLWRISPLAGGPTSILSLRMVGGCYPAAAENHSSVSLVHCWCLSPLAPLTRFLLLSFGSKGCVCLLSLHAMLLLWMRRQHNILIFIFTFSYAARVRSSPLDRGALCSGVASIIIVVIVVIVVAVALFQQSTLLHSTPLRSSVSRVECLFVYESNYILNP